MTKQEEQAKIMAVLGSSDQTNNQLAQAEEIQMILARLHARHLARASQVPTQIVHK